MNTLPIDKKSDYYRICEECGTEFMATDFREKFCNKECSQKYRDRKKRIKKMTLLPVQNVIPEINKPDSDRERILKKNISILKEYPIGKNGIVIPEKELVKKGFNFEIYHSRVSNSDGVGYFIEYGQFFLSREKENEILVKIKQK